MKKVYGYIRVSTVRQGEGVSLGEQKKSIENYALKNDLQIIQMFEEKQTASKKGRPVFSEMIKLLKKKKADGVIIHKIDRSARNLSDWAEFSDLLDNGIEIHCSFEAIDFATRGGRLMADMFAVLATDHIRNHISEVKKGLYGRLDQGIYPFYAPIGYLNTGGGNIKEVDKHNAPLVRKLFELYSTGNHSIIELVDIMFKKGLRNRNGNKVTRNGISFILHNPFYIGIIRLRKNGNVYQGVHPPLVSERLFNKVQVVMRGKTKNVDSVKHDYIYRRCIQCGLCNKSLIAERQKGNVYYRCHTPECPTKTVRQEIIENSLLDYFSRFKMSDAEIQQLESILSENTKRNLAERDALKKESMLNITQLQARLDLLTEKLLDGIIDNEIYNEKKISILNQIAESKDKMSDLEEKQAPEKDISELAKLLNSLHSVYLDANLELKRRLLKTVTSNLSYVPENLGISTYPAFLGFVHTCDAQQCGRSCAIPRTLSNKVEYKVTKNKFGKQLLAPQRNIKNKRDLTKVACLMRSYPDQCHKVITEAQAVCLNDLDVDDIV